MTDRRTSIFNFNHIDKNISQEQLSEIRALYQFNHKRFWSYKKAYKYFKRLNLIINVSSTGLVVIGTVVGSVTLNPIVLGSVSGAGLLLKTCSEIKDFKKKIEMTRFAYTTYEKVLFDLRSCLRGNQFNQITFINDMKLIDEMIIGLAYEGINLIKSHSFINDMKLIDEMIIDLCPPIDKFETQYKDKFIV